MKRIFIIICLILSFLFIIFFQYNTINKLNKKYDRAMINTKTLMSENINEKNKSKIYEFTIDQLKYFNDSINLKIDSIIKDNKIKTKKIEQLQYQKTITSTKDTIITKDTIFVKSLRIDTTLIKKGYILDLKLEYPNKIMVHPTFENEQYVIFTINKETIDPPKKFFLLRLFQKKHTVINVDIYNTNEYVDVKEKRFIKTIK